MGGVFNNQKIMLSRDLFYAVQFGWMTGKINRSQRFGSFCNFLFDFFGADIRRILLNVGKYGFATAIHNGVCGRGNRHWSGDNLVSRSNAGRGVCRMQGGGSRRKRYRVLYLAVPGYCLFKLFNCGPLGNPVALQYAHNGSNVALVYLLMAIGNGFHISCSISPSIFFISSFVMVRSFRSLRYEKSAGTGFPSFQFSLFQKENSGVITYASSSSCVRLASSSVTSIS